MSPRASVSMESTDNLDAVVSLIMVNLPFPPMPIMASRGDQYEDASCSSHDLLSQAISCSIIECWNEMDKNLKTSDKQEGKMQVLMDLNQANASLHNPRVEVIGDGNESKSDPVQAMYELFGNYFRSYMSYYPGTPDLRFLPMDSVDQNSTVYKQAIQHVKAKRYNVNDASHLNAYMSYREVIELYSRDLLLENTD